jgi:Fe2+ transport system protein FeoA
MCSLRLAYVSDHRRPLSELQPGDHGVVAWLSTDDAPLKGRLFALGITRGAPVVVLQMFPGVVFQCDQTELAIERAVASIILVDLVSS